MAAAVFGGRVCALLILLEKRVLQYRVLQYQVCLFFINHERRSIREVRVETRSGIGFSEWRWIVGLYEPGRFAAIGFRPDDDYREQGFG